MIFVSRRLPLRSETLVDELGAGGGVESAVCNKNCGRVNVVTVPLARRTEQIATARKDGVCCALKGATTVSRFHQVDRLPHPSEPLRVVRDPDHGQQ